jgi:N-glycosylase/DNA lyase
MSKAPSFVGSLGDATRNGVVPRQTRSSARSQFLTTPMTKCSTSHIAVVTPTFVPSALFSTVKCDEYNDLKVKPTEFRPSAVLTTGQCFHWKSLNEPQQSDDQVVSAWGTHNATEWIGTLRVPVSGESIVIRLRETESTVLFHTISAPENIDVKEFLKKYFQMEVSIVDLHMEWSTQCDRLKRIAGCIPGHRLIDQDPWECLVSFLCSSNNNIPRITKILQSIRYEYGEKCCTYKGEDNYSFPSLATLHNKATEADLRGKCGMGYRAKYLIGTMNILHSRGGEKYLQDLRSVADPNVVQERLLEFPGVGRKVADCIALFSLRSVNAIPVDVHVWKIARRDYGAPKATTKTLTPTAYKAIADLFQERFPRYSGWAHSLLFVAELPSFRPVLPPELIQEMDKVGISAKRPSSLKICLVSKLGIRTQEKNKYVIDMHVLCC